MNPSVNTESLRHFDNIAFAHGFRLVGQSFEAVQPYWHEPIGDPDGRVTVELRDGIYVARDEATEIARNTDMRRVFEEAESYVVEQAKPVFY